MILNDEQLAELRRVSRDGSACFDCIDTIADLKRQVELAEIAGYWNGWHAPRSHRPDMQSGIGSLDAYVQEKVDRAVLEESEWWAKNRMHMILPYVPDKVGPMGRDRLAANRAKVVPHE